MLQLRKPEKLYNEKLRNMFLFLYWGLISNDNLISATIKQNFNKMWVYNFFLIHGMNILNYRKCYHYGDYIIQPTIHWGDISFS